MERKTRILLVFGMQKKNRTRKVEKFSPAVTGAIERFSETGDVIIGVKQAYRPSFLFH